ncbi:MAG: SapC family protein [Endozoicomonas sp.]
MSKQLLIYKNVVPVNKAKHGNVTIKNSGDYSFARSVNSVPLTAVEFPHAAEELAIVFAGEGPSVSPVVIMGVKPEENLFISNEGRSEIRYLPAFLRRYPFVFSTADEGENFTLCIDEDYPGLNQEGSGERLFDSDGEQTQYLDGVLNFLKEYQAHFTRTQQFCKKLVELELLQPMSAEIQSASGESVRLTGFQVINREKLQKLPGNTLAELSVTGELELAYIHLQSLRNLNALPLQKSEATTQASQTSQTSQATEQPEAEPA